MLTRVTIILQLIKEKIMRKSGCILRQILTCSLDELMLGLGS